MSLYRGKGVTVYKVYRNPGALLDDSIRAAVIHFKQEHDELPVGLSVHPSLVGEAQRVVKGGILVSGNGGCLVGEVWLEERKQSGLS